MWTGNFRGVWKPPTQKLLLADLPPPTYILFRISGIIFGFVCVCWRSYPIHLLIEFSHKKTDVKNPARGHKVEKYHPEGKNVRRTLHCCCCLHIKNRSDLYPVPSNIRTGPTDANERLPWSQTNYPKRVHIVKKQTKINKRTQKSQHTHTR